MQSLHTLRAVSFPRYSPFIKPISLIQRVRYSTSPKQVDHSSSAKLFQDAALEEKESPTPSSPSNHPNSLTVSEQLIKRLTQEKPWDGEESTEDAVLCMLVDKYKPLRTGQIRTADAKLKSELSTTSHVYGFAEGGIALDSLPPLQPPSAAPKKSLGTSKAKSAERIDPEDAKARAEMKRAKKVDQSVGRIGRALENSLDYRMEKMVKGMVESPETASTPGAVDSASLHGGRSQAQPRPNPVSMQGWANLVEGRIERARAQGAFTNLAGRGKPLQRETDEANPFIAREEFLMNRIVKRNGAAPPWVDIQGELEQSISTFRNIVQSSWVRRATRTILASLPPPPYPRALTNVTLESISNMRDEEWEKREESYHEIALKEVNSMIRKHNGVSPYAVRRSYLQLRAELDRCYRVSAEEILERVEESLNEPSKFGKSNGSDKLGVGGGVSEGLGFSLGLWGVIRRL